MINMPKATRCRKDHRRDDAMKKIVSVLIPVFNAEKFAERCVRSAAKDLEDEIEIVVIDDGSDDRSPDIVKSLCNEYRNIRFYEKTNENNIYAVRKKLIELAQGEYLMFLDSDDYWTENAATDIVEAAKEGADIILFGSNTVNLDGQIIGNNAASIRAMKNKSVADLCHELCRDNKYNALWNKCIKADLLRDNRLLTERNMSMGEDALILLAAVAEAETLSVKDSVVYNYRKNPDGASAVYKLDYLDDFAQLRDFMCTVCRKRGVYEKELPYIDRQYLKMVSMTFISVDRKDVRVKTAYMDKLKQISEDGVFRSAAEKSAGLPFYLRIAVRSVLKKRTFVLSCLHKLNKARIKNARRGGKRA